MGRRSAKQRLNSAGEVVEQTEFTWDGTTLIEQRTAAGSRARAIAMTWEHSGLVPIAQAEKALDGEATTDARFFAIVTDLIGTPTELVSADGALAWRTRSTLWGTTAVSRDATAYTPLRHPGQYADAETGLNYNLHRHYDPAVARYTSADPLGLEPAPNPVAWVINPYAWIDPHGLSPAGKWCTAKPVYGALPEPGQTALYTIVDPTNGKILKWGVSDSPIDRYTMKEYEAWGAQHGGRYEMQILRNFDTRQDAEAAERYLTERVPGPENHEAWAGAKRQGAGSWESVLQDVQRGMFGGRSAR